MVSDTPQIWGSPSIDDDLKLFGNFGYTSPVGVQVYAHTNYARKTVTGGFFFRNPNTRGGVFSIDGGQNLLVGDRLWAATGVARAGSCPSVPIGDNVPDADALAAVEAHPDCFTLYSRFPGGFTPSWLYPIIRTRPHGNSNATLRTDLDRPYSRSSLAAILAPRSAAVRGVGAGPGGRSSLTRWQEGTCRSDDEQ